MLNIFVSAAYFILILDSSSWYILCYFSLH